MSGISMVPEAKTVRAILDGSKLYQIPDFQRDYSWRTGQQDDFLKDLLSNIKSQYFFGTIIVVKSERIGENDIYTVIDGQQRLTTFVIFLKSIRDLIVQARLDLDPNAGKSTGFDGLLVKNVSTDEITGMTEQRAVLLNAKLEPILPAKILDIGDFGSDLQPQTTEQKLTLDSYKRFKSILSFEKIKETLQSIKARPNPTILAYTSNNQATKKEYIQFLMEVAEQLVSRSSMVVITSDSQSFAQTIFKNLNSRGIALNSIDLMKNELFDVLNYQTQAGVVQDKWAGILRRTSSPVDTKNGLEISPEDFFVRYWNLSIKMSANAIGSRKMFEHFEKNFEATAENYKNVLENFEYVSKVYESFFAVYEHSKFMGKENYFLVHGHFETLSYIQFLRQYKQERTLVLALFIARQNNRLTDKQFKNILRATTYFRIMWQIGGGKPNRLTFLDKIARMIYNAVKTKSERELVDALALYKKTMIERLTNDEPKNVSVESVTRNIGYFSYTHEQKDTNLLVKHVLTMFELKLRSSKPMNNEFQKIFNAQIEHVIPLADQVDTLANLSLISESEEEQISKLAKKDQEGNTIPAGFELKKDIYKESEFKTLTALSIQSKFDTEDLESRQDEMGRAIFEFALQKIDYL